MMNSTIAIDKLIIRYNLDSYQRINLEYINQKFSNMNDIYSLAENIKAYIVDATTHKEIPDSKLKLCVAYKKEDIGILYLDCSESSDFYFKISKSIFYSKKYTIIQVVNLVDSFFELEYNPTGITRMEISVDSIEAISNELYIIADLCKHNQFFKSLKEVKNLEQTSSRLNGRNLGNAKYGLTVPNLSIGTSNTISGATNIGKPSGDSYIRCYVKSNKQENYQREHFRNIFGDKDIYRLEVSMNSKAIEDINVDINSLDIPIYLKEIYFKACKKKLTFNILGESKTVKGKIKYDQICLLDKLDFGELSDEAPINEIPDLDDSYISLKKNINRSKVKQNRAKVSKKIGTYYRENGDNNILEEIIGLIEEIPLDFKIPNEISNNISISKKFGLSHLKKNHSSNSIEIYQNFIRRLIQIEMVKNRIKNSPEIFTRTLKEKFSLNSNGHINGIKLVVNKIEVE